MTVIIKNSTGKMIKDATMVANDLKTGKIGYNNKGRVVGTFNPTLSDIPTKTQIITFDPPTTSNFNDENKYTIDSIISIEYPLYTVRNNGRVYTIDNIQIIRSNYGWNYAKSISTFTNTIFSISIDGYSVSMPKITVGDYLTKYVEVEDYIGQYINILFTSTKWYIRRTRENQDTIKVTYI